MQLVQGMYANARSPICVGEGYSEEFEVKVGVHQGSVLSPLLFIIVLEALSREFRSGVPWEDLYANDLVIIAELLEECVRRLLTLKEAMEKKGLRVNAGKTKIMICCKELDLLQSSGEFSMYGLSHWSGQQQQFLQWLQALDKRASLQLYTVPGNCIPPGMGDHRRRSRSDLKSLRW